MVYHDKIQELLSEEAQETVVIKYYKAYTSNDNYRTFDNEKEAVEHCDRINKQNQKYNEKLCDDCGNYAVDGGEHCEYCGRKKPFAWVEEVTHTLKDVIETGARMLQ